MYTHTLIYIYIYPYMYVYTFMLKKNWGKLLIEATHDVHWTSVWTESAKKLTAEGCNALQQTAPHCNTLNTCNKQNYRKNVQECWLQSTATNCTAQQHTQNVQQTSWWKESTYLLRLCSIIDPPYSCFELRTDVMKNNCIRKRMTKCSAPFRLVLSFHVLQGKYICI